MVWLEWMFVIIAAIMALYGIVILVCVVGSVGAYLVESFPRKLVKRMSLTLGFTLLAVGISLLVLGSTSDQGEVVVHLNAGTLALVGALLVLFAIGGIWGRFKYEKEKAVTAQDKNVRRDGSRAKSSGSRH